MTSTIDVTVVVLWVCHESKSNVTRGVVFEILYSLKLFREKLMFTVNNVPYFVHHEQVQQGNMSIYIKLAW